MLKSGKDQKPKPAADPVAAFIEKMPDQQQAIARTLRDLVRQSASTLRESIKWGCPCYAGKGNVCSIMSYADHVNLALFRGAELADPDRLLEGTGKAMRHVKFRSVKDIRKRAVAALIGAATVLDSQQ